MKPLAFIIWSSPVIALLFAMLTGIKGLYVLPVALVALMILAIRKKKLPLVNVTQVKGANARNWPMYVEINNGLKHFKAVREQERYEALYKANPVNLIKLRFKKYHRAMEIMGHEVEVQAAVQYYGVDEGEYRAKEAWDLTGYKQFRGVPVLEIEAAMKKQSRAARKWLDS